MPRGGKKTEWNKGKGNTNDAELGIGKGRILRKKMTFEQRSEGNDAVCHVTSWSREGKCSRQKSKCAAAWCVSRLARKLM